MSIVGTRSIPREASQQVADYSGIEESVHTCGIKTDGTIACWEFGEDWVRFYSSGGSSQKLGARCGSNMRGRWMNPVPGRSVCR